LDILPNYLVTLNALTGTEALAKLNIRSFSSSGDQATVQLNTPTLRYGWPLGNSTLGDS
jgi:hypothetical protein